MIADQMGDRNEWNGRDLPCAVGLNLGQCCQISLARQGPVFLGPGAGADHRHGILSHPGGNSPAIDGLMPFADAQELDPIGKFFNELFRLHSVANPIVAPAPIPGQDFSFSAAAC